MGIGYRVPVAIFSPRAPSVRPREPWGSALLHCYWCSTAAATRVTSSHAPRSDPLTPTSSTGRAECEPICRLQLHAYVLSEKGWGRTHDMSVAVPALPLPRLHDSRACIRRAGQPARFNARIYVPRFLSGFGGDVHRCAKHARCAHLVLLGWRGRRRPAGWLAWVVHIHTEHGTYFMALCGSQEARRVMCSFSIWTGRYGDRYITVLF